MFLLYSKKTHKTGKILSRVLRIQGGITPPTKRPDVLIRWGSSVVVPYKPDIVLNQRDAVILATDKLNSLKVLQKSGVRVPEIFPLTRTLSAKELKKLTSKFPLLARTILHQRGTDILLCMQLSDIQRAARLGREYLVAYIPTNREYRVHIFSGKSIKVSEKISIDDKPRKPWLRNHQNGYTFRIAQTKLDDATRAVCKKAVKALGLTFGAVDVIISDSGEIFVLEINTGPGLIKSGVRKYATHLAKKLGIKDINHAIIDGMEETNGEEE